MSLLLHWQWACLLHRGALFSSPSPIFLFLRCIYQTITRLRLEFASNSSECLQGVSLSWLHKHSRDFTNNRIHVNPGWLCIWLDLIRSCNLPRSVLQGRSTCRSNADGIQTKISPALKLSRGCIGKAILLQILHWHLLCATGLPTWNEWEGCFLTQG